jgi:hypothetical protein
MKIVAITLCLLSVIAVAASAHTSWYDGYVGRSQARFELTFEDGSRRVYGTYRTLRRTYRLDGVNERSGQLTLNEYTDGVYTSISRLRKSNKGKRITWSGTMYNIDGRKVPIRFTRTDYSE